MKKSIISFSAMLMYLSTPAQQAKHLEAGPVQVANTGFYENKGQLTDQNYKPNPNVKYLLCSPGFNVQLRQTGFSYDTYTEKVDNSCQVVSENMKLPEGKKPPVPLIRHYHRVDIELLNSNPNATLVAEGKSEAYYNYFTSGTPQGGVSYVHSYQKVTYKNIYPNIDLVFGTQKDANSDNDTPSPNGEGRDGVNGAEYSFVVHPGGKVADIKLQYKGENKITLADNKLVVNVNAGNFSETIPDSYLLNPLSGGQTQSPFRGLGLIGVRGASVQVNYTALGNNTFGFVSSALRSPLSL